jgi:hypothetical protein
MNQLVDMISMKMKKYNEGWFITGGWALDLFIGLQTRPHNDIDLCILRKNKESFIRYCQDSGFAIRIDENGYEIHVDCNVIAFDCYLLDDDNGHVRFRWNKDVIIQIKDLLCMDSVGYPFIAPEWVILTKAWNKREKDKQDLLVILSYLSSEQYRWLAHALESSGHEWAALLRN